MGTLVFYAGLIDQHNGYFIPDGIDATALRTLEAAAVGLEFQRLLTNGANQDLQQFGAEGHKPIFYQP
jgi:hypothetical protein